MTKYLLTIDWDSNYSGNFAHIDLEAKTIVEAMTEAQVFMTDYVYLMTIAEKTGKQYGDRDHKMQDYTEVLTNRGHGWNTGDCSSVWTKIHGVGGAKWHELKTINA